MPDQTKTPAPKTIVITGSSRGIGFGLAQASMAQNCNVVISARGRASLDAAVASLSRQHAPDRILGVPCDVSDLAQVQALWQAAVARFGRIDIWINNAGTGHPSLKIWQLDPADLAKVININMLGVLICCRVAINGMLAQSGGGHIYLMDGLGSDGMQIGGTAVYGTTKYAQVYLRRALVKETRGTPIKISSINPGIVITELLQDAYIGEGRNDQAGWNRAKRVFNILGDKVETVTPWLVEQILVNRRAGNTINWLTRGKVVRRFAAAPFNKRDLFDESHDA